MVSSVSVEIGGKMKINKLTNHKWLNLFNATKVMEDGSPLNWIYASRKKEQTLEAKEKADAVIIIPIVKDDVRIEMSSKRIRRYSLITISEYRIPIMDYEIGFPAGLIDGDEDAIDTAKRELREETGLDITRIIHVSPVVYSSAGMTDESIIYVYCEAEGTISNDKNEKSEDIRIIKMNDEDLSVLRTLGKIGAKAYPILLTAKKFGIESLLE